MGYNNLLFISGSVITWRNDTLYLSREVYQTTKAVRKEEVQCFKDTPELKGFSFVTRKMYVLYIAITLLWKFIKGSHRNILSYTVEV